MKKSFFRFMIPVLGMFVFSNTFSQNFEGTIEFKKQTATDTINYVYYVKGNKVRIDEIGSKSGKLEGSLIIDLKEKKMIGLSPERKIYFDKAPSSVAPTVTGTPEVEKTKNTKTIHGYKCTEYLVKSKEENTQLSYWVAEGKFDFFDKLVKFLNRKDKFSSYYLKLPSLPGMFTLLAVESPLDGKEKARLEVTKIEKKTVDASKFDVPKDYKKQTD